MKLTEELILEHEKIRNVLKIMGKISENIKTRKVFYTEDVESIVKFIFVYWDKCHCKKEENVLFPALISEGVLNENDNIALMIEEHVFGVHYLKEINSCVENCKIGNPFSSEILADSMITYASMLQTHMQNEENYFFSIANNVLSEAKQKQLVEQFELIDKKLVKQKVYEQFEGVLNQLEVKYLS